MLSKQEARDLDPTARSQVRHTDRPRTRSETIVDKGTRNQLQESLLAVFGHVAGIETDVPTTSEVSAGVHSEPSSHGTVKLDDAKTLQHGATDQSRKESKRTTGTTVVTIGLCILAAVFACFFLLFSV